MSASVIACRKDHSNNNLAHIIKPAVALVKNTLAYNAAEGTATTGSWTKRDFNTVEGESWFLSLNTSTSVITVEPGMYYIKTSAPFVRTGYTNTSLYNESTSSHIPEAQGNMYIKEDAGIENIGQIKFEAVLTFTTSTNLSLRYYAANNDGGWALGSDSQNLTSAVKSNFSYISFEKLK